VQFTRDQRGQGKATGPLRRKANELAQFTREQRV